MESDEDIFDVPVENNDLAEEREDQRDDESVNKNEANKTLDTSTVKRRVFRNPQPKLNADRLCSEKGLPALMKLSEEIKFKGKGREKEDLNKVMRTLEHWAHRLYPKLQFDECLEKIEQLGSKKPVQNWVKRMRLGMEDVVVNTEEIISEDHQRLDENEELTNVELDPFDELISNYNFPETDLNPPSPVLNETSNCDQTLSEEQINRMEQNRILAEQRRNSKHKKNIDNGSESFLHDTNDEMNLEIF